MPPSRVMRGEGATHCAETDATRGRSARRRDGRRLACELRVARLPASLLQFCESGGVPPSLADSSMVRDGTTTDRSSSPFPGSRLGRFLYRK